jgi:plastocyanin
MRRPAVILAGLGAVSMLATAATLLPAVAGARPSTPALARLQVTEKEYSLILSRLRVTKGQAIVEVLNFGMDNHDLVIQSNAKGSKPIQFPQLAAGAHATKTITLPPGKYTMWCSIPGHKALGMVAPLTVTK